MAAQEFWDLRRGKDIEHSMLRLLHQAVYGRMAGHDDTNDADDLWLPVRRTPADAVGTQTGLVDGAQEKLVKIGAKVVRHARYIVFQMADVAVPRELLGAILNRIQTLSPAPT